MAGGNEVAVIAVDDSAYSQRAFQWYLDHMHKDGNKVVLVHSMELPAMPSRDTWEKQTKSGREKGSGVISKFTDQLEQLQISHEIAQDFEKPGEYICHVAVEKEGSVIVMGTRGMGKIRRTILGSVSNYVLNHARCPVLVCRSPKDDE